MDINKIKSTLKMENFYFSECSVKRNSSISTEALKFDLQKEIKKIGDYVYRVELSFVVNKEHNDLNIKIVAVADFTFESDDKKLTETIIEKNTVAIMFPFIRSQVSLLSTQPGLTPIIIPPINTANL